MKHLLLISLIGLTIVACKSEKKSEDCSINGVKVSCDEFRRREEQKPQPEQKPIKAPLAVDVVIKTKYTLVDGVLKTEKDIVGEASKTEGNSIYTCMISKRSGAFNVTADERELQLEQDGAAEFFQREYGSTINPNAYHLGTFMSASEFSRTSTLLKISATEIEVLHRCYFTRK